MNIKWKKWAVLGLLLSVPLLSGGIFQGCSELVQIPSAPGNLEATRLTCTSIKITWSWSDKSTHRDGYYVYRKCGDGEYEKIAEALDCDFYDYDVSEGVQYTYYVTAYNSTGESGPSNEAGA